MVGASQSGGPLASVALSDAYVVRWTERDRSLGRSRGNGRAPLESPRRRPASGLLPAGMAGAPKRRVRRNFTSDNNRQHLAPEHCLNKKLPRRRY